MQTSEYYELNLVEGTDLVNPLLQDVPNYETIDEVMHDNAVNSVPLATELKSGTVHALTRTNGEAAMFRFVATSRYDEGDTFTVDGIQVSGLLTDGTTLSDGAYAINANVLCCLTGTVLTLFTVPGAIQTAQNALKLGGELPSYYGKASDVTSATNVANAASVLANDAKELAEETNSNLLELEDFSKEHIIGHIGNKNVYERLYMGATLSAGSNIIDSALTSLVIDNLISAELCYRNSRNQWRNGFNYYDNGSENTLTPRITKDDGLYIYISNQYPNEVQKYNLKVRYTKV